MASLTGAPTNSQSSSQLELNFQYDWQGRRIQKSVATNSGSSYVGSYTNGYAS